MSFRDHFPILLNVAMQRDARVVDPCRDQEIVLRTLTFSGVSLSLEKNVGKMVVDPFSNQIFFDWEMEMVEHFLQLLHSVSLHVNSKNKLVWTAS